MTRPARLAVAALLLSAVPAFAQTPQGAPAAQKVTLVGAVQAQFEAVKGLLLRTAEMAPDSVYSFRPTPEVRTFGELLAHIADAHHMVCITAVGGEAQPPGIERSARTKPEIIAALAASYEPCDRAFQQSDTEVLQPLTLFGMQMTRMGALALVGNHDWEHYGNLVTYLRMNGMVPPSSQR
jgi:uncharacterized damage-inducible protein DinB